VPQQNPMRSLFAALVRKIGLALAKPLCKSIVAILLLIELTIAYPLPAVAQPSPAPSVTSTPAPSPQPAITKKNPPAPPAPKQEQAKSGGPYDLKAIQESYKSLYGS
jgi:hypothetical protein